MTNVKKMLDYSIVSWKEDMAFEVEVDNHKFMIDASEKVGGKDAGPRPKKLMLSALAGCTGMDVISILNKMKVKIRKFSVVANGNLTQEHPKYYDKIMINYEFWGKNLPKEKIEKAIKLSQEKYCGVSKMMGMHANIGYEIVLHNDDT